MSRHTYSNGIMPRLELAEMCDKHYPKLGPSPKLVGMWYRGEVSWKKYSTMYRIEMEYSEAVKIIEEIIKRAKNENITVLCIEKSSKKCHRRLLLEICWKIDPSLEIIDK